MKSYFDTVVYWSWLVLFLVWLPGWVTGKRPSNVPNLFLQIPVWVLIVISFVLLLYPGMNGLSFPITPHNVALGISGLVLVLAGVAFAIWARFTLGSNWSGIIMGTKEEHDLVQTG